MYTVISSKRNNNGCKHLHETRDQAQKCLLQHQSDCRKSGKISDRIIVEVDSLDDVADLEIL